MQSLTESVRELGELEADWYDAVLAMDIKRVRQLEAKRLTLEKRIRAKFKIVVVCPGHLVNKWAREVNTNFSQLRIGGEPVQVVIPGRVPRRRIAYEVIGSSVVCAKCGSAANVKLSKEERLKGMPLTDKLNHLKSLKCSNPKCDGTLIEMVDDCPIEDIDEAFTARGLSAIILSKEEAKLGASWQPAFIRRTVHTRSKETGTLTPEERAQCPRCGGYIRHGNDYLHPDELSGKRMFCRNTIERPKRENGKVVLACQTVYEWRGTTYSTVNLPEGIEPRQLVEVEREVPVMEKVSCRTPLFSFSRLGSNVRKTKTPPKPRNSYGQWVNGVRHPNHGSARWELAKVIARRHRGEYLLILDEVHQCAP